MPPIVQACRSGQQEAEQGRDLGESVVGVILGFDEEVVPDGNIFTLPHLLNHFLGAFLAAEGESLSPTACGH